MSAVEEAEKILMALLDEQGGDALCISREEFARLLMTAPEVIEYKPRIPGCGAHAGYAPTFANRPLSYA